MNSAFSRGGEITGAQRRTRHALPNWEEMELLEMLRPGTSDLKRHVGTS
jgi:hypothetical protein